MYNMASTNQSIHEYESIHTSADDDGCNHVNNNNSRNDKNNKMIKGRLIRLNPRQYSLSNKEDTNRIGFEWYKINRTCSEQNGQKFYQPIRKLAQNDSSLSWEKEGADSWNKWEVLNRLNSIRFSALINQKILFKKKQLIGSGRYGRLFVMEMDSTSLIAMSEPTKSNNVPCSQSVMKCILNRLSFNLELKAYQHILKFHQAGNYNPFVPTLLSFKKKRFKVDLSTHLDHAEELKEINLAFNCLPKLTPVYYSQIYFLLIEFACGGDLNDLVTNHCPGQSMPLGELIFYICEIAESLLWLHEIGIVHQDLKGDNVLIKSNGHVLLTDFGLSHVLKHGPGTKFYSNISTSSQHMPPEIAAYPVGTKLVWHAADWYSFGVLIYRLLCAGNYPPQLSKAHMVETFQSKTDILSLPNLPLLCQRFIEHLLCPNPEKRLGSDLILGGNQLFSHPGLIYALFIPTNKVTGLSSAPTTKGCAASVLNRDLKHEMFTYLNKHIELQSMTSDKPGEAVGRRYEPNLWNKLPDWVGDLRMAIRQQSLLAPYKPISGSMRLT